MGEGEGPCEGGGEGTGLNCIIWLGVVVQWWGEEETVKFRWDEV